MTPDGSWKKEEARVTSEVARRAIRRLDVLEWVILAAAAGLAIGGGALVAWILAGASGTAFRTIWMVTSLVLFVVPGAIALVRLRREERKKSEGSEESRKAED